MRQIDVGVIGTGWCGGIRAVTAANSPLVRNLSIAESDPDRLREVAAQTNPLLATSDYQEILANPDVEAVMISATPETTHHPMTKAALEAGKHVLLEKPMALTLDEADELIEIAERMGLKFTIGYSQRFNVKQALVKRSLGDGTLGEPVSVLISRHITRKLADKIGGRIKLSPAATDVRGIARAIADAGADAISAVNTLPGMAIDRVRRRPLLGNTYGGLSGPALKPVALRVVYEVAQVVKVPIVGIADSPLAGLT